MADSPSWRNRIVAHGDEDPEQLLAHPENWRIHPRYQQAALEGVLDDVGWVQSVIVNRTTGHLIDGHLRVMLALRRNEPSIPVDYVELSADEEALILATLDPLSALAVGDESKLSALLEGIESENETLNRLLDGLRQSEANRPSILSNPEAAASFLEDFLPDSNPHTKPIEDNLGVVYRTIEFPFSETDRDFVLGALRRVQSENGLPTMSAALLYLCQEAVGDD